MNDDWKHGKASAAITEQFVTVCSWSNTVKYEGEWMPFADYLESRFGLLTTHGMSPKAAERLRSEEDVSADGKLNNPKRLAAVRATGLLDKPPTEGFDRITRLGAAALNVPVTFIALVESHRDFYLSHWGFKEPLASERQLTGQTICQFTIRDDHPLIIPDTRADPVYAKVPTVESFGVGAYLGVPLVLASGEVIGSFCATDSAPHDWNEEKVQAATDLAQLVISEIELRQAALDFQRQLNIAKSTGLAG
jgi:hypothetical protein